MTSIKFSLSKKQRKETRDNEVLLRVSFSRQHVFRAKTNIYVCEKYWEDAKEKIVIPRIHTSQRSQLIQIQSRLDALKNHIMVRSNNEPAESITKKWLEDTIYEFHFGKRPVVVNTDFDAAFKFFISSQAKTEHRKRQLGCLLRMLKRFELYLGGGYRLNLDEFSDEDLVAFENFLSIEHTFFNSFGECIKYEYIYIACPEARIPKQRGENTLNTILKSFRTFYNWAVKAGKTTNNPFKKYKLKECVYGTPYFMTLQERNKLLCFDLSAHPQLAVQRDIFIFQSCVGMRIGDFYQLTEKNIINDAIEYIPSKTANKHGNTVRVPLCELTETILKRYEKIRERTLLPFISEQKYNLAIKKILRMAGITRMVTIINPVTRKEEQHPICDVASSHMARRNFIGNIYKKVQDPDAIGSMTGHVEGSKAFARYRVIDDSIKKNLISAIE